MTSSKTAKHALIITSSIKNAKPKTKNYFLIMNCKTSRVFRAFE